MARSHNKNATKSPDQYRIDFESAHVERRTLLLSAIDRTGMNKFKPLAMLVFNMVEKAGGEPLGWTVKQIASELGLSSRTTARNWTIILQGAGILAVNYRPRSRGGCQTNLLAIDWDRVRKLVVNRTEPADWSPNDRAPISVCRATKNGGRAPNSVAPIKEYPSYPSSPESNTTTTALPHAQNDSGVSEEEEDFRRLVAACKAKFPKSALPRQLEEALRSAMGRGCSIEQLWKRCAWWREHWSRWPELHRPGACYTGLAEATTDMAADHGWPYQR
jgi:hypothetical protein